MKNQPPEQSISEEESPEEWAQGEDISRGWASEEQLSEADALEEDTVAEELSQEETSEQEASERCPICTNPTTAKNFATLRCDHTWCRECLIARYKRGFMATKLLSN